jgi:hypothetical protein
MCFSRRRKKGREKEWKERHRETEREKERIAAQYQIQRTMKTCIITLAIKVFSLKK